LESSLIGNLGPTPNARKTPLAFETGGSIANELTVKSIITGIKKNFINL
jgi:hypothetical protein